MNFKELQQEFVRDLAFHYPDEEATVLFQLVIERLTGWARAKLLLNMRKEVPAAYYPQFNTIREELQAGRPIQHILSEAWFYGMKFKVNGFTLIPRPETEELVAWVLKVLTDQPAGRILDIGTGSGCIAISIKKNSPLWETDAIDVSADALIVAAENAARNEVNINFIQDDILKYSTAQKYNVIVSNPPYIKEDEMEAMHQNVLAHEPHLALFVSNDNPLIFYKAIADLAITNLNTGGSLFFEINEYLPDATVQMLQDKGFIDIELRKDLQGKPRMIRCRYEAN